MTRFSDRGMFENAGERRWRECNSDVVRDKGLSRFSVSLSDRASEVNSLELINTVHGYMDIAAACQRSTIIDPGL